MNYRGIPYQMRNPYHTTMPNSYPDAETPPSQPQPPPSPQPQPQSMGSPYEYYETPFEHYAKPEQPTNWYAPENPFDQTGYPEPTSSQTPSFVNPFQTETGQLDFNKMLSTVGQLADTVQQVSPFIKQVGAMIKIFR